MAIQINGTTGISGVDGSAGTPALQGQDTNTGISFGTDEVNVVTGGNIVTRFDSSGRVLIGQNDTTGVDAEADDLVVSSTAHTGITVRSGSSHNASVYFADQDAVRQGRIEYNHTSDYMRFNTGGTERLRITSDGTLQLNNSPGIDFSQIQTNAAGMTSETLDSYEEGTFTVTFKYYNTSSGWQNVGFDSSPGNTTGHYIKIGKFVQFSYYSQGFDIGTGSGLQARVIGLPFNVAGGNANFCGAFFYHTNCFQQNISTGYCEPGTGEIQPIQPGTASNATWDGGGTRYLMMSGIYRAA